MRTRDEYLRSETPKLGRAAVLMAAVALVGFGNEPQEGEGGPVPQRGGGVEPIDGWENDPSVLSPPLLHGPALTCGTAIKVSGFVPGALIRVYEGGSNVIGDTVGLDPDEGVVVPLNMPLDAGWDLTATQEIDGTESGPSNQVTSLDHTDYYDGGLPPPEIPFVPLYECGVATVVSNLPQGGEVEVFSDAISSPIGQASGVGEGISLWINPPFEAGHNITAVSSICGDTSPPSEPPHEVQPAPETLPAPEVPELYEDGTIIVVGGLVNGSFVTIEDQATGDTVSGGGAPAGRVRFGANPAVSANQVLEVRQELCGNESPPTTTTVRPCSELPAPVAVAPLPGDTQIQLSSVVPGARVFVYSGSEEIGDSGGSTIQLVRPVAAGETLFVVQRLGQCWSSGAYVVPVGSGLDDPNERGPCEVESFTYGYEGDITFDVSEFFNAPDFQVPYSMAEVPIRGRVFYPVGPGRFPVAAFVHGNTIPPLIGSEDGYDYLLEHLASHCIVATSIDEGFLNGRVIGEMDARGIVMLRHLQEMRSWDRDPTHPLFTNIDLSNVLLGGHSRGGEAAVIAKKLNGWLHDPTDAFFDYGFGLRSIYAIAPVDGQITRSPAPILSGFPISDVEVTDANYFIIHGSHDGDVSDFQGQKTYDRAFPVDRTASRLKALRFVHGANHKQFNTVWAATTPDFPASAADGDVLDVNRLNTTAYTFATIKGWLPYRAFLKREVTFPSLPGGMTIVRQYQDPTRKFINHHEEDANLMTTSVPGGFNDASGAVDVFDQIAFDDQGAPNWLWQQTEGLLLGWQEGRDGVFEANVPPGHIDAILDYPVLAFRTAQVFDTSGARNPPGINKDFSVRLVIGGNAGPSLPVSNYVTLVPALDTPGLSFVTKTVMSSVRIPWADLIQEFSPEELREFNGEWQLRFELDRHDAGLIVVDEIQASE